jgi:transcriptional regulator with XRE-family HTH domain
VISGDLLREARLRAGLTQKQLARRAGTSQPAIARWESGAVQPSFERLRELIRTCGLELTYGLANYDDSYDEWIEQYLALPTEERIEQALSRAEQIGEIRPRGSASSSSRLEPQATTTCVEVTVARRTVLAASA